MLIRTSALLVLLGASASCLLAGDLAGQVHITRKLTKKKVEPIGYNVRTVSMKSMPEMMDAGSEFSRMVVWLEGGNPAAAAPVTAVLTQKDRRFDPSVVVVPVGSTVSFPNADPVFHNVFSLSKTKQFDLGYYPQGQSRAVKFAQSGVVQVYCHVHPNMYAAIVVTGSPWHAIPGPDGTFDFQGIPAGTYELMVWHNAAGLLRQKVTVPKTGRAVFDLNIPIEISGR